MRPLLLAAAAAVLAAPVAAGAQAVSASALLGAEVLSTKGETIGHVTDLAIDLGAQRVRYAMVYAKTPPAAVAPGPGSGVYGVPLEALKPGLRRDTLVLEDRSASSGASDPEAGAMRRASRLIGREVESKSGVRLGEIAGLAVDLGTGQVLHVTLAPEGGPRRYMPLDWFRFPPTPSRAVLEGPAR